MELYLLEAADLASLECVQGRIPRQDALKVALGKFGSAQALEAKRRQLDKKRRLIGLSKFGPVRSRVFPVVDEKAAVVVSPRSARSEDGEIDDGGGGEEYFNHL